MSEYIRVELPNGEKKHYWDRRLVARSIPGKKGTADFIGTAMLCDAPERTVFSSRGMRVVGETPKK